MLNHHIIDNNNVEHKYSITNINHIKYDIYYYINNDITD
jgi:hypothetical protein